MQRRSMGGLRYALRVGAAGLALAGTVAGRVQAQTWAGRLSGNNQVPAIPNDPASGFATLTLTGNVLAVNVLWSGLIGGPAVAAHIHCCARTDSTAQVAVPFTGFPSLTSGTYTGSFDLSNLATYNPGYLSFYNLTTPAAAESFLLTGLNAGRAYVNIHNATYQGGEIRANVAAVPEPTSVALMLVGMGGMGVIARRRLRG